MHSLPTGTARFLGVSVSDRPLEIGSMVRDLGSTVPYHDLNVERANLEAGLPSQPAWPAGRWP